MAQRLPRRPRLPPVKLPKVELMTESPVAALSEVRTSLSDTLANIEAALPAFEQGQGGEAGWGAIIKEKPPTGVATRGSL